MVPSVGHVYVPMLIQIPNCIFGWKRRRCLTFALNAASVDAMEMGAMLRVCG